VRGHRPVAPRSVVINRRSPANAAEPLAGRKVAVLDRDPAVADPGRVGDRRPRCPKHGASIKRRCTREGMVPPLPGARPGVCGASGQSGRYLHAPAIGPVQPGGEAAPISPYRRHRRRGHGTRNGHVTEGDIGESRRRPSPHMWTRRAEGSGHAAYDQAAVSCETAGCFEDVRSLAHCGPQPAR
jgi:hypothetical protein